MRKLPCLHSHYRRRDIKYTVPVEVSLYNLMLIALILHWSCSGSLCWQTLCPLMLLVLNQDHVNKASDVTIYNLLIDKSSGIWRSESCWETSGHWRLDRMSGLYLSRRPRDAKPNRNVWANHSKRVDVPSMPLSLQTQTPTSTVLHRIRSDKNLHELKMCQWVCVSLHKWMGAVRMRVNRCSAVNGCRQNESQ